MWKISCFVFAVLATFALAQEQTTPAPALVGLPPPPQAPATILVPPQVKPKPAGFPLPKQKPSAGEAFLQSFKTFFLTAANVGKAVWDFGTEPFRILAEASGKVLSGVGK
ncbi:hypothetical protein RRG08_007365 [Elysia crispata]|uniref:Uncharacterized protein n=1 Tax=Elysia crispata TaxID=231223 RepID=A0AAE1E358_9GAST|nr:hypothetical protein RRG08_007365 [Elysia crispata]